MKIEKQTLILLLMFATMAAMLGFVAVHDPYAERSRNEVLNLIRPLMSGMPFFN